MECLLFGDRLIQWVFLPPVLQYRKEQAGKGALLLGLHPTNRRHPTHKFFFFNDKFKTFLNV